MSLFGRGWLRDRPGSPSGVAGWRPARSSALCSSTAPAATTPAATAPAATTLAATTPLAAAAARSVVARDSVGGSARAPERAP